MNALLFYNQFIKRTINYHKLFAMFEHSLKYFIIVTSLCLSGCVSNTIPQAQTMLINLSNSLPDIWKLVTSIAYLMGFMFAVKGVHSLKVYGESRTMMSNQHNLKTPLIYFFVAGALLFSPTIYHSFLLTSFGTDATTPLDYSNAPNGLSPLTIQAFYAMVQVSGLFAFFRGWLMIARTAEHSSQPGQFGKGLTHILGGLLAINIVGTKDMIFSTLGFG
jgi:intracellular multiplication protein IcmC